MAQTKSAKKLPTLKNTNISYQYNLPNTEAVLTKRLLLDLYYELYTKKPF